MSVKTLFLWSIPKLLTSGWGWVVLALSNAVAFFATERYSFLCVMVFVVLDAIFGIMVALRDNKFMVSELARHTLFKIFAYGVILAGVVMIERLLHNEASTGVKIAAALAMACEFWSMSANILIIWPDSPFFKILRLQLKGEIAAKIGDKAAEQLVDKK